MRVRPAAVVVACMSLGGSASVSAQTPMPPTVAPFEIGERLTYRVRVGTFGNIGKGKMWVEGPVSVRGTDTYLLHSEFRTRVGPITAVNRSESWLDPVTMTALRFHKRERQPMSRHEESVELFPGTRRWEEKGGASGDSPTSLPLDELSFMYFLRTVPLVADSVYAFDRHFDAARNPIRITVVKRDTIRTGAGEFATVLVEMRVKDPRRYEGDGIIRIHFSDDARRLPVRIESTMPIVGKATLTLESYTPAGPPVVVSTP